MKTKGQKKKEKMSAEQRLTHLPSPMHLSACMEGGRVYRNKKKYTRKGKEKFQLKNEYY